MASWCRITIVLEGETAPDLAAVDELARWMLLAQRAGGTVTVDQVSDEMGALIELSGLASLPWLRVEVER